MSNLRYLTILYKYSRDDFSLMGKIGEQLGEILPKCKRLSFCSIKIDQGYNSP